MKNIQATIIIVNWNGEKFLRENFPSVLNQDYKNYKILIVDNGSSDGSIPFIKDLTRRDERIDLVCLNKNYGFVGGNNIGMKRILEDKESKFIVLLNNDIRVEKDWLSNLINGFDKDDIGICTSNIFLYYLYQRIEITPRENTEISSFNINNLSYHPLSFPNGYDEQGSIFNFPLKLSAGKRYLFALPYKFRNKCTLNLKIKKGSLAIKINNLQFNTKNTSKTEFEPQGKFVFQNTGTDFNRKIVLFEERNLFKFKRELKDDFVDAGCGGAMAIRADLLRRLGLFDDRFFSYLEDTELSYRFRQAGFKIKFVTKAICYHYFWATSGAKMSKVQIFYGYRNRFLFIKKHFGFITFLYYWLRTFARTILWGLQALTLNKKAGMYFWNCSKALISSLVT